jgi:hypothetical protein
MTYLRDGNAAQAARELKARQAEAAAAITAASGRSTVFVEVGEDGEPPAPGAEAWGAARMYLEECTLDGLEARRLIDGAQWRAGMLFRDRWLAAHPRESYAGRYKPREPGAHGNAEGQRAWQLDAESDVHAAMQGMREPAALALQSVAGEDEPAKGQLGDLREALTHLVGFYDVEPGFKRRVGV